MDIEYQIRSVHTGQQVYSTDYKEDASQYLNSRNPSAYDVYWMVPRSGRVRVIMKGSIFIKKSDSDSPDEVRQQSLVRG